MLFAQLIIFRVLNLIGINSIILFLKLCKRIVIYYLNIPNGFPTGKKFFPKCSFNTDAPEP